MIIIISGVDKVGKTTIGKRIRKYTNLDMTRFVRPVNMKNMNNEEWADYIYAFHIGIVSYLEGINHDKNNIIIDRFYSDEVVYSEVLRSISLWDKYKEIDERFTKLGTKYIYIKPPLDFTEYERRFKKEEEILKWEMVPKLLETFEAFYDYTELDKITITQETPVRDIINFICGRKKKIGCVV